MLNKKLLKKTSSRVHLKGAESEARGLDELKRQKDAEESTGAPVVYLSLLLVLLRFAKGCFWEPVRVNF